jgi:hypothetical protein
LQEVFAEKVKTVGEFAFCSCLSLRTVRVPNVKVLKDSCFRDCEDLSVVDVNPRTSAERYSFFGCATLENLAVTHGFLLDQDYIDPDGIADPTQGILRYLKFKRSQHDVREMKVSKKNGAGRFFKSQINNNPKQRTNPSLPLPP